MKRGLAGTALILFAILALGASQARAEEARSVGYVLSFRIGIDAERADTLMQRLAAATTEWHGLAASRGEPVTRACPSSTDCVRSTAKVLGVSRLGAVTLVAAAGVVRLDVRLLDGSTGRELQRTNTEFESSGGQQAAERAIFDLLPRLLPGEKHVPPPAETPETEIAKEPSPEPPVLVPSVREPLGPIAEPQTLDLSTASPGKRSGTRWWLWGGLGVAATATVTVAVILLSGEDDPSAPVLELPPAR